MPSRDDDSRWRILEAYARAKKADPTMTQGEFMRRGAPGAHIDNAPGRFSSNDSAARYFRKIISGERSGSRMYEAGRAKGSTIGNFNITTRIGGRYISDNIAVSGSGGSSFDIPAIEHELKSRKDDLRKLAERHMSKYGFEDASAEDYYDNMELRVVSHATKPARMRVAIPRR